jgi:uridine phosphorylase
MTSLSVLDLATVASGSTPAQALRETTEMAVWAESLGYERFWVAEHHGMAAVASSAPAVLIAHLAGATSTIRLGSGGVMLPNHSRCDRVIFSESTHAALLTELFGPTNAGLPFRVSSPAAE